MNKDFIDLRKAVLRLFFPRKCAFCAKVIEPDAVLCEKCLSNVRTMEFPICYRCGRSRKDCQCRGRRNRFITAFASPFYYRDGVEAAIRRLKFYADTDIAPWFGEHMAQFVQTVYPEVEFDFVAFVPMTKSEVYERGFNQSELLAEEMAKHLNLPVQNVLCKLYETERQRSLNGRRRSGNVLGVFDVREQSKVFNKRVLLCDDLCTTGSTLSECAKMLRIHGAREVLCITAATVFPSPEQKG